MKRQAQATEPADLHADPVVAPPEILPRPRIRHHFLDAHGREITDPRPMAPPVGYIKQPSIFELVRDQVQRELRLHAGDRDFETFEENEDFDIPDDPIDPHSQWENDFDPPMSEVRQALEDNRKAAEAGKQPAEPAEPARPAVPPTPAPSTT